MLTPEHLAKLAEMAVPLTIVVDGIPFEFRKINQRDIVRVTGKLAVLPSELPKSTPSGSVARIALSDGVLIACSISPKITMEDTGDTSGATVPLSRIPDAIYGQLIERLCAESGFSAEAANDIRPSSGTAEPS